MADITPATPPEINLIHAYGNGGFRVAGVARAGSLIVLPAHVEPWPVAEMSALAEDSLDAVLAAEPRVDLLLVGCGGRAASLPLALRARLHAAGIAVETMDTGAACRTYNVLVAEGRRVAAALIAIS